MAQKSHQSPGLEITARDVHLIFGDFLQGKDRKGRVPSEDQCRNIAKVANEISLITLKPGEGNWTLINSREDIILSTIKKLQGELEAYFRALALLIDAEKPAGAIMVEVLVEKRKEGNELNRAVNAFVTTLGRAERKSRRPRGFDDIRIEWLTVSTVDALKEAGRTKISASSEEGPVCFVVASLMTKITGELHTPYMIRHAKRRQNK